MLIGNKLDLVSEDESKREVTKNEAEEFSKNRKMEYIETSALTHKGVKEGFYKLVENVHRKMQNIHESKKI